MRNIYYLFSVKDKCFTDLSFELKRKNLFTAFYGLAYAKSRVLKSNIYTQISYVSDIINKNGDIDLAFLEMIEKKYAVTIADMIHADRHLLRYPKNRRLFIAQELLKLFIHEVNEFKITVVFAQGVNDFISYFAAYYCAYHGVQFFHTSHVGYAGRACLSSNIYADPNDFPAQFNDNLRLIKEGKIDVTSIDEELHEYLRAKKKPSYMSASDAGYKIISLRDIVIFFQCLFAYLYDRNGMHYDRFPLFVPFYRLQRIIRKFSYKKIMNKESIKASDLDQLQYFIYPLQLEPESSTLIQGRWFNDQRKIIEMISKNLPANTILIVKEHKFSIGRRALHFYQNIAKHHNVFFIDDTIDNTYFIEKSRGVIVISSTMGMEALLYKKPVLLFGQRFYGESNNVYRANNFKSFREMILQMLNHQYDWVNTLALFYTLFNTTTKDMGFLLHVHYTQDDIEKLATEIERVTFFDFDKTENKKILYRQKTA